MSINAGDPVVLYEGHFTPDQQGDDFWANDATAWFDHHIQSTVKLPSPTYGKILREDGPDYYWVQTDQLMSGGDYVQIWANGSPDNTGGMNWVSDRDGQEHEFFMLCNP